MNKTNVCILGGGYVGVWAYRSILRTLLFSGAREKVSITVISSSDHHVFHGWTGEILGGIITPSHSLSPHRSIFEYAKLIHGKAVSVDLCFQKVAVQMLDSGLVDQVPYDHLLFATGSRDHVERIQGMAQFGWSLKNPGGVQRFRNHLISVLEQAEDSNNVDEIRHLLSFAVVGGGFAGVEMCSAIAEWFTIQKKNYCVLQKHAPTIRLIHSGVSVLQQIRPQFDGLADYANEKLREYGVEVILGTRVDLVTAKGVCLRDRTSLEARTVLSTLGQTLTTMNGTQELPRTSDKRLITDPHLRVGGFTNVWAGGDIASVIHPKTNKPCPANALWAIKHGTNIGNNIARSILAKPLIPFASLGLGQAASLGIGKGAGELFGFSLTGWLAYFLRILVFLCFMPSRVQALRVALDLIFLILRGRIAEPRKSSKRHEGKLFEPAIFRQTLDKIVTTRRPRISNIG